LWQVRSWALTGLPSLVNAIEKRGTRSVLAQSTEPEVITAVPKYDDGAVVLSWAPL
jgi:hypothetical protein